jgi:hypothetical protein
MSDLTGAQAACLQFARREARCEHASQTTQTCAKKTTSVLRCAGTGRQAACAPIERSFFSGFELRTSFSVYLPESDFLCSVKAA